MLAPNTESRLGLGLMTEGGAQSGDRAGRRDTCGFTDPCPGQVQIVVSCPTVLPRLLPGAALCCQQGPTLVTKWLGLAPSPDSPSSLASVSCCSLSLCFPICEMGTMAAPQGIVDSLGGGTQPSPAAQHR